MSNQRDLKHLDKAIIFFLAVVFLFSGIDKIFHYEGFVNALRNYVLVPRGMAPYFAMPVIVVEIMIGLGLLFKSRRRAAALGAVATLALFSTALGLNHLYGERGICGCWFTITLAQGTAMHLTQNLILAAMAAVTWWDARTPREDAAPPLPLEVPSPT